MDTENTNGNHRLFLLDAYALIYRAYYAFIKNPITNSRGENLSAVFGFVTSLEDLLQRDNPSHLAVVFDPPGGSFRNRLFPDYKANREETPEDIKRSVPLIKKLIDAYHIPVIEVKDFEADDVIGTLAIQARTRGYTTYMMTPDKDFAQLVDDGIYIYKPSRSGNEPEIWDSERVKEYFGITHPSQVRDILALWGDASDNIPGAPGIGEKTSKKLIADYHDVEGVIRNSHQLKGKQKESIENNAGQIRLSKELVTIRTDVPVDFDEDRLIIETPDTEALKELFAELEFRTLAKRVLSRIESRENKLKSPLSQGPEPTLFPSAGKLDNISTVIHHYRLVADSKEIQNLAKRLGEKEEFCFDTETTGLDLHSSRLIGIAVADEEGSAYYIPVPGDREKAAGLLAPLIRVFESDKIGKVGQNLKFDIQMMKSAGIEVKGPLFDTLVAHYLLQPESRHKLDLLAETYLGYKTIPIEDLIGSRGREQASMDQVPLEKLTDYACEDADITLRLKKLLLRDLDEKGLGSLAEKIEMPLVRVLADMEWSGVNLHSESLDQYSVLLRKEIAATEENIYNLAGKQFNISSPKQLGEILFDHLKIIKSPPKTKTGQYSTNEELLDSLADRHEIVPLILEYRSLSKLLNTYAESLPRLVSSASGKLHTTFNQAVTSTGRLSSNNPNLQNIPVKEERGREIRKAFIPSDDEHIILSADYSQIELRLMAHMSRDEGMISAFRNDEDIHTATAARIFNVKEGEVTREMRNRAKTANFGIIYGISSFGLAQRLRISRTEAKEIIDGYFSAYPGVRSYMDKAVMEARRQGFVTTMLGRRRYLPDIHSKNAVVRGFAERNAINAPIQGSAADIIKISMVNIHRRMADQRLKSKMILQVHDELLFDVLLPELDVMRSIVKDEMENAVSLSIPLKVEMGTGRNWLEAH